VSIGDAILRLYLPLLSQETGIMVSAFTYGIKAGVGDLVLVVINTLAVITDLALFFLPTYFLSQRLHDMLIARFRDRYETGVRTVSRYGAFRTAAVLGFVMPSVVAMIVVGLLRLSFWRGLSGLFVGSAVYVAIPLVIALPLASTLPGFLLPVLQWAAPALFLAYLAVIFVRWQLGRRRARAESQER
jgi:hypothetical protein